MLCNMEHILVIFDIRSHGFFLGCNFLFIRSFGQLFGHLFFFNYSVFQIQSNGPARNQKDLNLVPKKIIEG